MLMSDNVFDYIANEYDARYYSDACSLENGDIESLLKDVLPPHAKSVLEIGCGTGHWLSVLSNITNIERLIGIEMSHEMTVRARQKLSSHRNVQIIEKDFNLYYTIEKFDLVVTIFFWSLLDNFKDDNIISYFKKIYDMIDIDGKFFIIENCIPNKSSGTKVDFYPLEIEENWDSKTFSVLYNLYSPDFLSQALLKSGFKNVLHRSLNNDMFALVANK